MEQIRLIQDDRAIEFLIEEEGGEGILSIGRVVAGDVEMVCTKAPVIRSKLAECEGDTVVLMAIAGHSPLLKQLEQQGEISPAAINGKRECYMMQMVTVEDGKHDALKVLVIAGSDKRGAIYGMFRFSELCGVSPLVYWGDVKPAAKDSVSLELPIVSKEPSVMYRGFFINDEWPAFGNWATEQFGGVNAAAYEKIFQLLLRLKGNYLWPAMWQSSFSEDGPGLLSAQLADRYGVIMGTSHHEPMCRAGVEWQNQYRDYGEDSTWSFISNEAAITKFWEAGLVRNLPFENVITIGMRGENDSKLLPADATMKDNVEVIKKAIRTQHALIRKHAGERFGEIPRMLAIYKEVEDYYYGDETCEGLKDWEELKDVIFLLSDDNYGNLRGLPEAADRDHPGGFGMYYHFDYHGAPVSYEWANCNRTAKTREQMMQAYEAGVRKMWIVNVGDLKNMEYPLNYFMDLAYDYEKWSGEDPDRPREYRKQWVETQFGERVTQEQKDAIASVLDGYTKWNAIRSPEALREGLFQPVHLRECDRIEKEIQSILRTADRLNEELPADALAAYQSMIYYQAAASLNAVHMYLDAARNKELARRGCLYANHYAEAVRADIQRDKQRIEEFHRILNGKWNHCLSSAHVGFRGWDDKDWTYPAAETVMPISGGKAVISFRGSDAYHLGAHWQDAGPLQNDDLTRPDCEEVLVDLDSRGDVSYAFTVEMGSSRLRCEPVNGRVDVSGSGRTTLRFTRDPAWVAGAEKVPVTIQIRFDNGKTTYSKLELEAEGFAADGAAEDNVFWERNGYCCIYAEHFSEKKDVEAGGFCVIPGLGREGAAVKALPAMVRYESAERSPYVRYSMVAEETGDYDLSMVLLARNPVVKGGRMRFFLSVNEEAPLSMDAVSGQYYTEWFCEEWAQGVLNHVRSIDTKVSLKIGRNDLYIYAGDPGVILEKLVLSRENRKVPETYLGPVESTGWKKD